MVKTTKGSTPNFSLSNLSPFSTVSMENSVQYQVNPWSYCRLISKLKSPWTKSIPFAIDAICYWDKRKNREYVHTLQYVQYIRL
jgi:hypothetical protein